MPQHHNMSVRKRQNGLTHARVNFVYHIRSLPRGWWWGWLKLYLLWWKGGLTEKIQMQSRRYKCAIPKKNYKKIRFSTGEQNGFEYIAHILHCRGLETSE